MQELDNWGLLDNWATAQPNVANKSLDWYPNYSVIDLDSLEFHPEAYRRYRTDAAHHLATGKKIVLAISGGVDSQAMLQSFTEAGIDFDIASMVFEREFNSQDMDFARAVARKYNKDLVEVKLDVFKFLHYHLDSYAEKYQCNSPQFACHHWFYEQLIEQGYDCIVAGGQTWYPLHFDKWCWTNTPARHAWWTFAKVNNFALHGNFLASTWQMNFSVALNYDLVGAREPGVKVDDEYWRIQSLEQYARKVRAFKRYGFDIIPQEHKFTGFEKVKDYFNNAANDPYNFEIRFRYPYEQRWPLIKGELVLEESFSNRLLDIKKSTASLNTWTWVTEQSSPVKLTV